MGAGPEQPSWPRSPARPSAVTLVNMAPTAPAGRGSAANREAQPLCEVHTAGRLPAAPTATKPGSRRGHRDHLAAPPRPVPPGPGAARARAHLPRPASTTWRTGAPRAGPPVWHTANHHIAGRACRRLRRGWSRGGERAARRTPGPRRSRSRGGQDHRLRTGPVPEADRARASRPADRQPALAAMCHAQPAPPSRHAAAQQPARGPLPGRGQPQARHPPAAPAAHQCAVARGQAVHRYVWAGSPPPGPPGRPAGAPFLDR